MTSITHISTRPKRILVVSDSLGFPSHHRGIFRYTSNLTQALVRCGHQVTLLVEDSPTHRLATVDREGLSAISALAAHVAQLTSIYNYLMPAEFSTAFPGPRFLARTFLRLMRLHWFWGPMISSRGLRLRFGRPMELALNSIDNNHKHIPHIPQSLQFLRTFAELALCDGIYSFSLSACATNSGPPTIDARGYDVILVDTPTYLRYETSRDAQKICVIHDLIPMSDPSIGEFWRKVFLRKAMISLDHMDTLWFVSAHTRETFAALFPHVNIGNSVLVHPSVEERRIPTEKRSSGAYLLCLVTDEPRKNIDNLLAAMPLVRDGIKLKLVGNVEVKRFKRKSIFDLSRVEFLGFVDEDEKWTLLENAIGVVVPSFTEGFGIPIVEGFFAGRPVFCSDIVPFREIAENYAIYFDPSDPRSIAAAINSYLAAPASFAQRIVAGQERCRSHYGLGALKTAVARQFDAFGPQVQKC